MTWGGQGPGYKLGYRHVACFFSAKKYRFGRFELPYGRIGNPFPPNRYVQWYQRPRVRRQRYHRDQTRNPRMRGGFHRRSVWFRCLSNGHKQTPHHQYQHQAESVTKARVFHIPSDIDSPFLRQSPSRTLRTPTSSRSSIHGMVAPVSEQWISHPVSSARIASSSVRPTAMNAQWRVSIAATQIVFIISAPRNR